MHSSYNIKY